MVNVSKYFSYKFAGELSHNAFSHHISHAESLLLDFICISKPPFFSICCCFFIPSFGCIHRFSDDNKMFWVLMPSGFYLGHVANSIILKRKSRMSDSTKLPESIEVTRDK